MIIEIILLISGFAMLLFGGDLLVKGASALAENFGIPKLVVGLTVVAFGTSAPELTVNLFAAMNGNTEISFGNIIGSNIANIGLVIGIAAMVSPLDVKGEILKREIPMMTLASILALIAGTDAVLRNLPNTFDRADGLVSLLFFSIFMYYTAKNVLKNRGSEDPFIDQIEKEKNKRDSIRSNLLNLFFVAAGLILLIYGGKVAVNSAVNIAQFLNVPKSIIGLTIIAVGTSLPELVTTIIAASKGETDLAIGNVVGSNLFNLLLVNGICSIIVDIEIPEMGYLDLMLMTFLSVLLLPLSADRKINRWEGFMLLSIYVCFSTYRVFF